MILYHNNNKHITILNLFEMKKQLFVWCLCTLVTLAGCSKDNENGNELKSMTVTVDSKTFTSKEKESTITVPVTVSPEATTLALSEVSADIIKSSGSIGSSFYAKVKNITPDPNRPNGWNVEISYGLAVGQYGIILKIKKEGFNPVVSEQISLEIKSIPEVISKTVLRFSISGSDPAPESVKVDLNKEFEELGIKKDDAIHCIIQTVNQNGSAVEEDFLVIILNPSTRILDVAPVLDEEDTTGIYYIKIILHNNKEGIIKVPVKISK